MTLRVTIEVVPYGQEEMKYPLAVFDISNAGLIEDKGFGHQICQYKVTEHVYDQPGDNKYRRRILWRPRIAHDRRDGFLMLLKKVLEKHRGCEPGPFTANRLPKVRRYRGPPPA